MERGQVEFDGEGGVPREMRSSITAGPPDPRGSDPVVSGPVGSGPAGSGHVGSGHVGSGHFAMGSTNAAEAQRRGAKSSGPVQAGARPLAGLPYSETLVAAEVAVVNARLAALGSSRRIRLPNGGAADREHISTDLFLALRETRDRRIFDLIYRLNKPMLAAFCKVRCRRLPVRMESTELLEETFLALWMKLENFHDRPDATFTGWAFVIADHIAMQAARTYRRDLERVRILEGSANDRVADDVAFTIADADERCRLAAEWGLLVALCAAGLERLPSRARAAVTLRDIEGKSYGEIADRLSISRGGVAMLLRRGRRRVVETMRSGLSLRFLRRPPPNPPKRTPRQVPKRGDT